MLVVEKDAVGGVEVGSYEEGLGRLGKEGEGVEEEGNNRSEVEEEEEVYVLAEKQKNKKMNWLWVMTLLFFPLKKGKQK